MALQSTGPISLNDIHKELGSASGIECSLYDADIRALGGVSSPSQAIRLSDFYGASVAPAVPHIYVSNSGFQQFLGGWVNNDYSGFAVDGEYSSIFTPGSFGTASQQDFTVNILGGVNTIRIGALYSTRFTNTGSDIGSITLSLHFPGGIVTGSNLPSNTVSNTGWTNLKIWLNQSDGTGTPDLTLARTDADSFGSSVFFYPNAYIYVWQNPDVFTAGQDGLPTDLEMNDFFGTGGASPTSSFYAEIEL